MQEHDDGRRSAPQASAVTEELVQLMTVTRQMAILGRTASRLIDRICATNGISVDQLARSGPLKRLSSTTTATKKRRVQREDVTPFDPTHLPSTPTQPEPPAPPPTPPPEVDDQPRPAAVAAWPVAVTAEWPIGTEPAHESASRPARTKRAKKAKPPTDGSRVFTSYAAAYAARYGTAPVRNCTVNSIAARLVERVGLDDAIALAAFYVSLTDQFYTFRYHPLNLCLRDAEGLIMRMRTGTQVTVAKARAMEMASASASATTNYLLKKRAAEAEMLAKVGPDAAQE